MVLFASVITSIATAQHFISFASGPITAHHHPFTIDSVIVAFNDTSSIGEVANEFKKYPQRAYLEEGAARQLLLLLKRSFVPENTQRHLVLKVDRLTIAEGSFGGSQFGSAGICVEFLEMNANGFVREYLHGTTVVSKALDVTHLHATNIQLALEDCFIAYDKAVGEHKLTTVPIPVAQLGKVPTIAEIGLPVLSTGKPTTGIYRSFMDMARNAPDTSVSFHAKRSERNDGTITAQVEFNDAASPKGLWGVCDDGDIFINNGKRFVLAERDLTGFHVTFDPGSSPADANAAAMGAVGGALGGVLFGAVFAAGSSSSSPITTYDLDMLTGQLVPRRVKRIGTDGTELSETVIINSTNDSLPIEVTMFGGREALLRKGQHHWVRSVKRAKPLSLGLTVNEQAGATFSIDTSMPNPQVYRIERSDDGTLKCIAAVNDAEAIVRGLDPLDDVK